MRFRRRRFLAAIGPGVLPLAGCSAPLDVTRTRTPVPPTRTPHSTSDGTRVTATPMASRGRSTTGYTHLRPDGNRVVDGRGPFPDAEPIDVSVPAPPDWLVGVPTTDGSLWAAVDGDGRVHGLRVHDDGASTARVTPDRLPPGSPPLLVTRNGGAALVTPPTPGASTLSHPLPLGDGRSAFVTDDGDLVLWDGSERDRIAVDAPPDARPVRDDRGRIAVLADATRRYAHGALGDSIEAGGVAVVDPDGGLSDVARIRLPDGVVIEGLAPVLSDVTGDGDAEVIVTPTDADRGARVAAFDSRGNRVATGPAIGTGYRWRHVLAVAPFGPDGRPEIAAVRTPHIGGVVEFYRRAGDALEVVATVSGYSSHAFGSRNLDGGLAGDCDADGRIELLVPTQDRERLAGLRRTGDGAVEAWRVPVGGGARTNLAAVRLDGRFAVAVGRDDAVRVWT